MENEMKSDSVIGVLLSFATISCVSCERDAGNPTRQAMAVAATIRNCPAWNEAVNRDGIDERVRDRLMKRFHAIRRYPLPVIREAIRILSQDAEARGGDMGLEGRLYWLNKYLFAVPSENPWGPGVRFDGLAGSSEEMDRFGLMWPWTFDESGAIVLRGCPVYYSGPPYDALEFFDHYRQTYGPRFTQE
jgi:hypothetical protein